MILKVRDENGFNISLNLNINYELEYIELTVNVRNKKAHTKQTKTFSASRFSEALAITANRKCSCSATRRWDDEERVLCGYATRQAAYLRKV